jgi:hypothetical protein
MAAPRDGPAPSCRRGEASPSGTGSSPPTFRSLTLCGQSSAGAVCGARASTSACSATRSSTRCCGLDGSLAPAARQRANDAMGSAAKTCSAGFGHAPAATSRRCTARPRRWWTSSARARSRTCRCSRITRGAGIPRLAAARLTGTQRPVLVAATLETQGRVRGSAISTERPTFAAASWRRLAENCGPKPCERGCLLTRTIFARSSPTEGQGRTPSRPLALFIGERGGLTPFVCPSYRLSFLHSLTAQHV